MAIRASNVLVIFVVFYAVSVAVVYTLSVSLGHVQPFIPHLSDLGDRPIESTIFTQLFVINATILIFLVQVRYVFVFIQQRKIGVIASALNHASVYLGHLSGIGLFVVACFQESHAYYVHIVSKILVYYSCSVVYLTLNSIVSRKICSSALIFVIRIVLNLLILFFYITFAVTYVLALKQFDKPWEGRAQWKEKDGGWIQHMISASSEWALIFLLLLYLLTFYKEFKNVRITKTRIVVVEISWDGVQRQRTVSTVTT